MYFIFQNCGQLVYPPVCLLILFPYEYLPMSLFLHSMIFKNNCIIFHPMVRPSVVMRFFCLKTEVVSDFLK